MFCRAESFLFQGICMKDTAELILARKFQAIPKWQKYIEDKRCLIIIQLINLLL